MKRYSNELKAEVVSAILDEFLSTDEVEAAWGVPRGTFGGWVAAERNVRRDRAARARVQAVVESSEEVQKLRDDRTYLLAAVIAIEQVLVDMKKHFEK